MSYASVWRLAIRYLIVPVTLGEITKIGCSNLTIILCTTARLCFNIFHCALARSAASFCHHMIKSTHSAPCDFKLEKKITSSRASQTGHRKCKPGIMQRLCTGLCLCVCVSLYQADVILGWSPVLGWEWDAKGPGHFRTICFYTGNPNCRFSTRYLELKERQGKDWEEKRGEETEMVCMFQEWQLVYTL